jgi:hypothetical protein
MEIGIDYGLLVADELINLLRINDIFNIYLFLSISENAEKIKNELEQF